MPSAKQDQNGQVSKPYDLEERTSEFALQSRNFSNDIPNTPSNYEYRSQFIRSSGSVAANCIEAREALSRKDCYHRFRICRKEAKECKLWLSLITTKSPVQETQRLALIQEAYELVKIFSRIITNNNEQKLKS